MAVRAMWKGVLTLADQEIPVKLYAAVENRTIGFNLLSAKGNRVRQRMVDPTSGDAYEYKEARRGVEVEPDRFVFVDEDELEEIEPEQSREIRVLRFVDPAEVNHQWYDRPYYLGPDDSAEDYFSLSEAIQEESVEGIVRWTMRNKEYVGSLRSIDGYLMLVTLRHADEVIDASELDAPEGRRLDKKERELAEQLIEALESDFDPDDYRDEYRSRVVELIEAKAGGKNIKVEKPKPNGRASDDLTASLEATLKAMKK